MAKVVELVLQFLWESLVTYAASAEGKVALDNILNAVEAAGIDVPFYTPTDGQTGTSSGTEGFDTNLSSEQSAPSPSPRRIIRQNLG